MAELAEDLTVCVPAYRCAPYLAAAVETALRLRGARIVIGEDRSGDDTLKVARALALAHPERVRLIENPVNLGMTLHWQLLFKEVRTPFVLKLDGDDLLEPGYALAALELLRRRPDVALVGGAPTEFLGDSTPATDAPVPTQESFRILSGTAACEFALRWAPSPCSSTAVYRLSAFRAVGGFNEQLHWCPDRDMWFRVGRRHAVAFQPAHSAWYRMHPDNVTTSVGRADRYCYELERMYARAAALWPERSLTPLFRRAFLRNGKTFFASAVRAGRRGRLDEVPERLAWGVRAVRRSLRR